MIPSERIPSESIPINPLDQLGKFLLGQVGATREALKEDPRHSGQIGFIMSHSYTGEQSHLTLLTSDNKQRHYDQEQIIPLGSLKKLPIGSKVVIKSSSQQHTTADLLAITERGACLVNLNGSRKSGLELLLAPYKDPLSGYKMTPRSVTFDTHPHPEESIFKTNLARWERYSLEDFRIPIYLAYECLVSGHRVEVWPAAEMLGSFAEVIDEYL